MSDAQNDEPSCEILTAQALKEHDQLRAAELEKPPQNKDDTLVRSRFAKAITFTTGAGTVVVKGGTTALKWGIAGARQAIYATVAVPQTAIEVVLRAAGNDVSSRSEVTLTQQEAKGYIESWLKTVHGIGTAIQVGSGAGLYMVEAGLSYTSDSMLTGFHFTNAVFGCTETSRAVAAIIALMKKELNEHPDGTPSDISTVNLLTTVASFLFLQRSGKRKTEIEWRNSGGEATIWDVMMDDHGFRADIVGFQQPDAVLSSSTAIVQSPTDENPVGGFESVVGQAENEMLTVPVILSSHDQTSLSDEEIRQRIMEQLPPGTIATVETDTTILKTVRVNIHSDQTASIEAPPGMVMVAEHPNFEQGPQGQTIVFRTATKAQSTADVNGREAIVIETPDADSDGTDITARQIPMVSVPTSLPTLDASAQDGARTQARDTHSRPSGRMANQKRMRKAVSDSQTLQQASDDRSTQQRDQEAKRGEADKSARAGTLRKALKSLSPTQSSAALSRMKSGSPRPRSNSGSGFAHSLSQTLRPLTSNKDNAKKPNFHLPITQPTSPSPTPRRTTPAAYEGQGSEYFGVHEKRREMTYSEVDSYSVHSNDSRPSSPTTSRVQLRASNSISKSHSQVSLHRHQESDPVDHNSGRHHRRSASFVPSLYSMGTKDTTDESVIVAPRTPQPRKSIFEDNKMLMALAKDGMVPGQFPRAHLVVTLRRFVRFASAAYGEQFLKLMGMTRKSEHPPPKIDLMMHPEHTSFSDYTGLPPETIVKSSFLDVEGPSVKQSPGWSPLIHFVTVDLEAKAIVLTCRGTLGLEDILTDMACDYADLYWRGQAYKVHRGIKESARRLMDSQNGNYIMQVLKQHLEQYEEFGLVFVGHSLGGAVAAVLAIMLSEPSNDEPGETDNPAFVTAKRPKLLPSKAHLMSSKDVPPVQLPPGRAIHVYTFGSPAAISSSLRVATRGLITSVVNSNDIFPHLSLGTLHDFRAVADRLKCDFGGAYKNIKQRALDRIMQSLQAYNSLADHSQAPVEPTPLGNIAGDKLGEDNWMWDELVAMRKVMTHDKLYPPGEIFILESQRMFDREFDESTAQGAEQSKYYGKLGRSLTRIRLKWVRDVETRFREVRFGRSMFHEHAPTAYENNLSALESGVIDQA